MEDIRTWTVSKPYLHTHCSLGEGLYYEPQTNTLRFVDIKKKQLLTLSLSVQQSPVDSSSPAAAHDGAQLHTLQLDTPLGVTADIEGVDPGEKILVSVKSGVAVLDRKTGAYEVLRRFADGDGEEKDEEERLRSNDGGVDPQGRFWVGTMNDFWVGPPQAEGECCGCSFTSSHPFFFWEGGSSLFPLFFYF